MKITDLDAKEYDQYYGRYINKLSTEIELIAGFREGMKNVVQFFEGIPDTKISYRYEAGKWNVMEIFQHLIDTERIFMYRCFRIARNDKTSLAGFDQNIYIEPSGANQKSIDSLINEFKIVRQSSILFLESITKDQLKYIGNANGGGMSARAAAFTIIGHETWHMDIINERYL
ncbi:DinB family protein [Aquimarina sp. BL5]|uniref:DinB family protein n=1 Tax=Aquimarina sp. BL5 TaxID=1714860 RepID=UPI000E4E350A|nr:DinB family protein [Aquimarina sp. BL5]AXT50426.1 DinB family protein [Aquimarina sp. BL5]RKN01832.1 DinB family protein [Aquimarina sp. BL5]